MMHDQDLRFFLRLDAVEYPRNPEHAWVVSGQSYRGRYESLNEALGATRRHVRIFDPGAGARSAVLYADQLEPDPLPWKDADAAGDNRS